MNMNDPFTLYIDRLRKRPESISIEVDPAFMEISEKELLFSEPIFISGQASLLDNHLLLDLKIQTHVSLPCIICNQMFSTPLIIDKFVQTQDIDEIKGALYSYKDEIRTALLLKVPLYPECHSGRCPERQEMAKYLK